MIVGAAVMFLGAALFALGLFHDFKNGTCSTTGYARNYGPVPHCASGVGWWALLTFVGILLAVGAAFMAGATSLVAPLSFVAVGAPFIALGLGVDHSHITVGTSTHGAKVFSLIFGGAFVVSGARMGGVSPSRVARRHHPG